MTGGIPGVQISNLNDSNFGTVHPINSSYGEAVAVLPNASSFFAASGDPYEGIGRA